MASRSLYDLRFEMQPLAERFVTAAAASGIDMLVTCTLRTNAEQEQLYAQGRTVPGSIVTDARPGFSAHNHGLAMDVVPIVAGKCVWNTADPAWRTLGALGQAAGLDWAGAPGFPFHEFPHFQMPNWRQLAGLE